MRARLRQNDGQGLVELLISLTMLTLAVGALISVLVAGAIALQRTDQKGTATTLADKQLEVYRVSTYANIKLAHDTFPYSGATTYGSYYATISVTGACTGVSKVANTCLVVDNAGGETACAVATSAGCSPVQTVTGPDGRRYEIDTYITYYSPPCGSSCASAPAGVATGAKRVLVLVRDPNRADKPVIAQGSTVFQPLTIATT